MCSCFAGYYKCKHLGLLLRDSPHRKSLAVENDSVWQVSKRLAVAVGVTSGRLHPRQLDSEGGLGLARQGLGGGVKGDGPVVDIGVVRIRPDRVALAAKDTPVHVVEVGSNVALAHVEVDTVGKFPGEIVDRPVQPVLVGGVGARRVPRLAVTKLAAAAVWRANAPELRAGRLWDPGCGCFCGGPCLHDHTILCVLPEDAVAVDTQAVCPSLDPGQGDGASGADIAPVLVRFCVEIIILEVEPVTGDDGDGVGDTGRECDLTCPSPATGCLDITRNILSN
jgi:hypothetical protein